MRSGIVAWSPNRGSRTVVDLLHDNPNALKECCLVSKSWIPRTRKHLLAEVNLHTEKHLESWKKALRDPSITPAYHTNTLSIGCAHVVTAVDVESGGWLDGFLVSCACG